MMEPHPTAGSDCTCSVHRQCCQLYWSPRLRVIATTTASARVPHLRDAMPLVLEFHTRAMPCLRADDGYSLLSSDVKHLL